MKHRVWCKNKKEFESDITFVDAEGNVQFMHFGKLQFADMDNHILEYGTGITDTGGVEIFEGDVVHIDSWSPSVMQIKFIEGAFCLCHREKGHYVGDIHYVQHAERKQAVVIGNIHQ